MRNEEYILINSEITEKNWYIKDRLFVVYLHLLLTVSCDDGTIVTTYRQLSNQMSITEEKLRYALDALIVEKELSIIKCCENFVRIKVTDYHKYVRKCDG